MRGTEHFKRHLSVVTEIDGQAVAYAPVEDPFHTTNVVLGWNLWDWLRMLFSWNREVIVRVKVRADPVAQRRWFQGQDVCEQCLREPLPDDPRDSGEERRCAACSSPTPPPEPGSTPHARTPPP